MCIFCYDMGCKRQVLLLFDDTSLWAIFAGGESELMDLSPAHIKIDKSPTGERESASPKAMLL